MKTKLIFAGATIAALGAIAFGAKTGRALDHQDSPATVLDRAADIADVFAFMKPESNGEGGYSVSKKLVLAMTFQPGATATTKFDPAVDYIFRVRAVSSAATLALGASPNFKVICNFTNSTPQRVLCNANGTVKLSDIGEAGPDANVDAGDEPLRVFAGLRSDPAFADLGAFKDTIASGQNKFKSPGVNSFDKANVMAIVVELDYKTIGFGDAGAAAAPLFAVGGETKRN